MKYALWIVFCLLVHEGSFAQSGNSRAWARVTAGGSSFLDKYADGQFRMKPSCGIGLQVRSIYKRMMISTFAGYKQMGAFDRKTGKTIHLNYGILEGLIGLNFKPGAPFVMLGVYGGRLGKYEFPSPYPKAAYVFKKGDFGSVFRLGQTILVLKKIPVTLDLSGYVGFANIYKDTIFPLTTRSSTWTGNLDISLGAEMEIK